LEVGDFTLYSAEGRRVTVPDPSGGIADAAGDFDGLLWRHSLELPVLGQANPHNEVEFATEQAAAMEAEIAYLLERESEQPQRVEVRSGAARRGLLRLRDMARWCAAHEGSRIAWSGD
jgi:hypothetical protein